MNNTSAITQEPVGIDLDNYKDMSVGDILRKTREHYGKTLPEVEADLRIRASQLDALEKLRLEKLPGRVYAIGFVRAYSEYLGLDGDKMVHLFKAQSVGRRAKPNLKFPVTYDENNSPNAWIVSLSMIGIVLFISYWGMFKTPTKYVDAIPPVPEVLQQGNINKLKSPVIAVAAVVEESVEVANAMELIITQDSWVEVVDAEGKKLISQVLKAGDKYIVPEGEGLTLTTGNAGGVSVFIKGKEVGTVGRSSQVKRNVKLVPESFVSKE